MDYTIIDDALNEDGKIEFGIVGAANANLGTHYCNVRFGDLEITSYAYSINDATANARRVHEFVYSGDLKFHCTHAIVYPSGDQPFVYYTGTDHKNRCKASAWRYLDGSVHSYDSVVVDDRLVKSS